MGFFLDEEVNFWPSWKTCCSCLQQRLDFTRHLFGLGIFCGNLNVPQNTLWAEQFSVRP